MKCITIALLDYEYDALINLSDQLFPFFHFVDEDDKVKSSLEYLVEREVAENGN